MYNVIFKGWPRVYLWTFLTDLLRIRTNKKYIQPEFQMHINKIEKKNESTFNQGKLNLKILKTIFSVVAEDIRIEIYDTGGSNIKTSISFVFQSTLMYPSLENTIASTALTHQQNKNIISFRRKWLSKQQL